MQCLRPTLAVSFLVTLSACGSPSGPTDAGPLADAGPASDAGPLADAGPADAGTEESLEELLRRWYADYNAGQGTDYLDAPHTLIEEGDPRYTDAPAHRFREDVAYGPFPRNVLDLWAADSAGPTPVAVFIHGGGFQSGSKDDVHRNPMTIPRLLAAGISVASIHYRWAYRDPDAALMAPTPDGEGSVHDENGTRLDYILRDCARAVQFLRYRAADWNLDPSRIGAWGSSAGAGCSVWTATLPDLADPEHEDPVLRESTRLSVVGHTNGQPTYHWPRWPALLDMEPDFVFMNIEGEAVRLTQTSLEDLLTAPEAQDLNRVLDYYEHLGVGDPPFYTSNGNPDLDDTEMPTSTQVIHHPRSHHALYLRCQEAGLRCEVQTEIESSGYRGGVVAFLIEHLAP